MPVPVTHPPSSLRSHPVADGIVGMAPTPGRRAALCRSLLEAFRARSAGRLTHLERDSDHLLSNKRVALARALLSWLGDGPP